MEKTQPTDWDLASAAFLKCSKADQRAEQAVNDRLIELAEIDTGDTAVDVAAVGVGDTEDIGELVERHLAGLVEANAEEGFCRLVVEHQASVHPRDPDRDGDVRRPLAEEDDLDGLLRHGV